MASPFYVETRAERENNSDVPGRHAEPRLHLYRALLRSGVDQGKGVAQDGGRERGSGNSPVNLFLVNGKSEGDRH